METGTAITGAAPSAGLSALDKDTLREAIKEALLELVGECLATPAPTGNGHVPRSFSPCELLALHALLEIAIFKAPEPKLKTVIEALVNLA